MCLSDVVAPLLSFVFRSAKVRACICRLLSGFTFSSILYYNLCTSLLLHDIIVVVEVYIERNSLLVP